MKGRNWMWMSAVGLLVALTLAHSQNPVPVINQPLIPDTVAPGPAGFRLTVNGTGFVSGAVVHWNGSPRATTFVSQSRLTANILSFDVASSHTASVTVLNPGPGGGTSNTVFFPVTLPVNLLFAGSAFPTAAGPASAIVLSGAEDRTRLPPQRDLEAQPQRAEMVYRRVCDVVVFPGDDFELHVPLNERGKPDQKHVYITGQVHFRIKNGKCGTIQVKTEDKR